MARTCYIHIGMHKTGSSAIQQSLDGYDDGKVSYCNFSQPNHSIPLSMLFTETPNSLNVNKRNARSKKQIDELKAKYSRELAAELEKTSNTIFSAEGLSTNLTQNDIGKLLTFLEPHYSEIQVIAYIRPILSWSISAFQQRVKIIGSSPFELPTPNYRRRFDPWINLLGAKQICFIKYDRAKLVNNDVVEDFCSRVGVEVSNTKQVNANQSMSAEAAAVLYCHNKNNNPPVRSPQSVNAQKKLVKMVQSLDGRRFSFSPLLINNLMDSEAQDIDWMEKQAGFLLRDPVKNAEVLFSSEDHIISLAKKQAPKLKTLLIKELRSSGKHRFNNLAITNAMSILYLSNARGYDKDTHEISNRITAK